MLASKICRLPLNKLITTNTLKAPVVNNTNGGFFVMRVQNYASKGSRFTRRSSKLAESVKAPAGTTAINLGQGLVAGASVVGLGALCYYGLGMSKEVGAMEKSVLWPQEVRQRIRDTYMYFLGSLGVTAGSAVLVSRTPALMNLAMKNGWLAIIGSIGLMIGTSMVCQSIPYKEGFGAKQLAWLLHSGTIGFVLAPITMMGGPLLVRAAWYTAGVVGALSTVAACAPSDKFLKMGGPLAIGLGLVFASSIGSAFVSPVSALGAGLYSISIYGGAVLFGLFLLYDTQKIIYRAENHPSYSPVPFDPVNASIGIYMDTVNLFIRIAMILAGGNRKK